MCLNRLNKWVNCDCDSNGRKCNSEISINPAATGVTNLDQAVDRYNAGGDLYFKAPQRVDLYYHEYNPVCNGFDDVESYIDACQIEEGEYKCTQVTSGREFGEREFPHMYRYSEQIYVNAVTEGVGYPFWDEPDEQSTYVLDCNYGAAGEAVNCVRTENPNSRFTFYEKGTPNMIGPAEQRLDGDFMFEYKCESEGGSSVPCLWQRNIDAGPDTDAMSRGSQVRLACPTGVYFFGEEREVESADDEADTISTAALKRVFGEGQEYIGYTFLSPDAFEQTNFYQACELYPGDYQIIELLPVDYGSSHVVVVGRPHTAITNDCETSAGVCSYTPYEVTRNWEYAYVSEMYQNGMPLIGPGQGAVQEQIPICDTWTDTFGKDWFTRYVLLIKDAGNCKLNDESALVNKVFGWCEECSYLTIAQQNVSTNTAGYADIDEEKYKSEGSSPYETRQICAELPFSSGVYCRLSPGDGTFESMSFQSPLDQNPESTYLLEKQIKYLKEGVMPVLDMSDDSNWAKDDDVGPVWDAYGEAANAEDMIRAEDGDEWDPDEDLATLIYEASLDLETVYIIEAGEFDFRPLLGAPEGDGNVANFVGTKLLSAATHLSDAKVKLANAAPVDLLGPVEPITNEGRQLIREARDELELAYDAVTDAKLAIAKGCEIMTDENAVDTIIANQEGYYENNDVDEERFADDHLPFFCERFFGEDYYPDTVIEEGMDISRKIPLQTKINNAISYLSGELDDLEDAIITNGPGIVIVDTVALDEIDSEKVDEIMTRAMEIRNACGSCSTALAIDNGLVLDGDIRREKYEQTLALLEDIDDEVFENIDIFAIGFYPTEYMYDYVEATASSGGGFSFEIDILSCDMQAVNDKLLYELQEYGNIARVEYQKMVLVNKLSIDIGTYEKCWESEEGEANTPLYSLFSNLLSRQRTLTKAGIIGMIYSEPDKLEEAAGHMYNQQFCSLEKATRLLVADPPMMTYTKVPLQEQVSCEKCSQLQIALGQCSTTCANGVVCTMPELQTGDSGENYGCPKYGFPQSPSTVCTEAEKGYYVKCEIRYGDGRLDSIKVRPQELDAKYPDVIASLPSPNHCSVQDETGNYTFVKAEINGKPSAPIIFSYSDDPDQDCGVPDPNEKLPYQCAGSILNVRGYSMDCEYKEGCIIDEDCNTGQICHVSTNRCYIPCSSYLGCADGSICDLTFAPETGACKSEACDASTPCPEGYACDSRKNECKLEMIGSCTAPFRQTNVLTPEGSIVQVCYLQCRSGVDCSSGQTCDTRADYQCRNNCAQYTDCGSNYVCDFSADVCMPASCTSSDQCPSGSGFSYVCGNDDNKCKLVQETEIGAPACNYPLIPKKITTTESTTENVCVYECITSEQCGALQVCNSVSHRCVDVQCTPPDTGCSGGQICDPDRYVCRECVTNSDCEGRQICNPSTYTCEARGCSSDLDCVVGEHCNLDSGTCIVDTPPPVRCIADAQCGAASICGEDGTCVPAECLFDEQCHVNQICDAGRCIGETGSCSFDFECGLGQRCQSGRCVGGGGGR